MKNKLNFFKKNKFIFIILLIYFLINIYFLFINVVWWDSAVYIGMGKFLYSFGKAGFWEASRPIIWPLFLGFIWKIGLNAVIFGKILGLLFGIGCIYLTYLISKKIFDERIALVAALFLSFMPTFFFFSTKILSGIPSLFFILLSIYFFIDKKFFSAGLFAGIAFLTRFLELFLFFIIFILFLIYFNKKKNFLRNLFYISGGFLVMIIPYLIFNYFMYQNIFYPFDLQLFLTKNTGWMFYEPFWFYFISLFKENFLSIFAILGLIFIFKKPNYKKFIILFSFLLFFIFFTFLSHKESRFMLIFLPYLCILTSYGIFIVFNKIKNKKLVFYFFILIFLIWFIQVTHQIKNSSSEELNKINKYIIFQNYLDKDIKGDIWISNPVFAVYSDKKIDELMYYPTFDVRTKVKLKEKMNKAEHILIDTCDIPCPPSYEECIKDKGVILDSFKENFNLIYFNKINECEQYIFAK